MSQYLEVGARISSLEVIAMLGDEDAYLGRSGSSPVWQSPKRPPGDLIWPWGAVRGCLWASGVSSLCS